MSQVWLHPVAQCHADSDQMLFDSVEMRHPAGCMDRRPATWHAGRPRAMELRQQSAGYHRPMLLAWRCSPATAGKWKQGAPRWRALPEW